MTRTTRTSNPRSTCRKARPPAPDLPAEVLCIIFEQLGLDYYELQDADACTQDFHALSLVSRTWTREAQQLIFRVIELRSAKFRLNGQEYEGVNTFSRFSRLMDASPHLAEYVKHLDIMIPRRRSQATIALSTPITRALDKINSLSRLDLQKEESPGGPFSLDDCSAHGGLPPMASRTAGAAKDGPQKNSKFFDTIIRLLPQITELALHNISLPSDILSSCTHLKALNLHSANLYIDPMGQDSRSPLCPVLKDVKLNGHALVCLKKLLAQGTGRKLLLQLSALEHLSLFIQAPENLSENSPQQLVLSQPTALTRLILRRCVLVAQSAREPRIAGLADEG